MKPMMRLLMVTWLVWSVSSCSFGPPESCGDFGGTADEAFYNQHFTTMILIETETGTEGNYDDEEGQVFQTTDNLAIQLEAKSQADVLFCVQERMGGGKVV